ncbi:biliverdin-producing heme oxygenase [Faunimonas pinastri]|nr:biliverdin-producing heme oxygenase [Faunimonas pinastri]
MTRLANPRDRLDILLRFRSLHDGAERVLSPLLGGMEGLRYAERRKTPYLDADIRTLGGVVAASAPYSPFTVRSEGEALGLLYVLEGSTLGGRVIFREMTRRGVSSEGLSFFDAYGSDTGLMWRECLAVLEREAHRGGADMQDEIVQGAVSGFRQVELWLCGTAAAT